MTSSDAVVVGSGPNGLAAAIHLAMAGASVIVLEAKDTPGGGTRTKELTLPGFRHDVCAAIHPMGAAGSFFGDHGIDIEWCHPEILVTHPLDDGTAGVLHRSIAETVEANGSKRWDTLFRRVVEQWGEVERDVLGPSVRVPKHPFTMVELGIRALPSATLVSRWLGSPQAGALFTGVTAHANTNLSWPMSSSAGVGLTAAGHVAGWPAAKGGSQAVADAMVRRLEELGGSVVCDHEVRSMADLPPAKAYLFDLTPWQVERIAGDRIPPRVQRAWKRFRKGGASFKVDYALDGPMPWTNPETRRAGTVHLGGTWQQVAAAEAEVRRGRPAAQPYVLVGQQSIFDDTRAPVGKHTLWAYSHVPRGYDAGLAALEGQFDRFAPGWRDLVIGRHVTTPTDLEAYNPNNIGGSIDGGAAELHQVLLRPTAAPDPYRIADTDMWLCGSSTPPGAGVHGLCGLHAARSALQVIRPG